MRRKPIDVPGFLFAAAMAKPLISPMRLSPLIIAVATTCAPLAAAPPTSVVTPPLSTNVLINPGKGWVAYGKNPPSSARLLSLAGAGYARYSWGDIEPNDGDFRWAAIDDAIAAWSKAGRQFAFGVMCASTHSAKDRPFVTPEWVFKAGAKRIEMDLAPNRATTGTPGHKIAPVFDDPIFLEKLKRFIEAFGARYDGNPAIAFVDVRSYGNWGEGHMHPFKVPDISPQKLQEHITMHRAAFKKTPLVIPWGSHKFDPIYDSAVAAGMGIRRDGICGNSDGSETSRCLGRTLAVFEFFGAYQWMKEIGWWEGKRDSNGYGHRLADCVEKGAPSYIGPLNQGGKDGTLMVDEDRALVERLANRMGYHFVLRRAALPSTIRPGVPAQFDLEWENLGIAPILIPCSVSLALVDHEGRVLDICPSPASRPAEWPPGKPVPIDDTVAFRKAPRGDQRLAIGILRPGETRPSIRLGIDVPTADGWHVLAPIAVR